MIPPRDHDYDLPPKDHVVVLRKFSTDINQSCAFPSKKLRALSSLNIKKNLVYKPLEELI